MGPALRDFLEVAGDPFSRDFFIGPNLAKFDIGMLIFLFTLRRFLDPCDLLDKLIVRSGVYLVSIDVCLVYCSLYLEFP